MGGEFGKALDGGSDNVVFAARAHGIELAVKHPGCHGARGERPRLDEFPAVEINRGFGDLAAGYFILLFQWVRAGSNFRSD